MISIPLFPLNAVLFPEGVLSLQIFEVRYLDMIGKCIDSAQPFGVVTLTQGSEVRKPEQDEIFAEVGTLAVVRKSHAPMPGLLQILCTGSTRFRVASRERLKNGLWVGQVMPLQDDQVVAIPDELRNTADALGELLASLTDDAVPAEEIPVLPPYRFDDCGWVANRWCDLLALDADEKLRLLVLDNPLLRLELVQDILIDQGLLT